MDRENLVEMIKPVVTGNGCDFWGLELVHGKNTPTIRVFIDAIGGTTIEDCEKISHELNLEFSLDDSLIEDYILEVSSPGLDRKIFYPEQLLEYVAKEVKLGTKVNHIMRHTVGLYHGQIGSKEWKRYLSDNLMARESDFQKTKHIMTIIQNNEKANQVNK